MFSIWLFNEQSSSLSEKNSFKFEQVWWERFGWNWQGILLSYTDQNLVIQCDLEVWKNASKNLNFQNLKELKRFFFLFFVKLRKLRPSSSAGRTGFRTLRHKLITGAKSSICQAKVWLYRAKMINQEHDMTGSFWQCWRQTQASPPPPLSDYRLRGEASQR